MDELKTYLIKTANSQFNTIIKAKDKNDLWLKLLALYGVNTITEEQFKILLPTLSIEQIEMFLGETFEQVVEIYETIL